MKLYNKYNNALQDNTPHMRAYSTLASIVVGNLSEGELAIVYNDVRDNKGIWQKKNGNLVRISVVGAGGTPERYNTGDFRVIWDNVVPDGWLPCDGRAFDTTQYPALYNLLGSAYTPNLVEFSFKGIGANGLLSTSYHEGNNTLGAMHYASTPAHGHSYYNGAHNHTCNSGAHTHYQSSDLDPVLDPRDMGYTILWSASIVQQLVMKPGSSGGGSSYYTTYVCTNSDNWQYGATMLSATCGYDTLSPNSQYPAVFAWGDIKRIYQGRRPPIPNPVDISTNWADTAYMPWYESDTVPKSNDVRLTGSIPQINGDIIRLQGYRCLIIIKG